MPLDKCLSIKKNFPVVKIDFSWSMICLVQQGNLNCEGKDMVQLVSSAPQSENLSPSHCHNSAEQPIKGSSEKAEMTIPICVVLDNLKPFPTQQSQILSLNERVSPRRVEGLVTRSAVRSHGENLSLEKSFRQGSMESWPQLKRRKIEHQQTHSFTTSPIFRVRKPNSNGRGPANMYLKNIEISTDTVSLDTFHVNESTDTLMHQEMNSNLIEGIASSFLSQNGEVYSSYWLKFHWGILIFIILNVTACGRTLIKMLFFIKIVVLSSNSISTFPEIIAKLCSSVLISLFEFM